MCPIRAGCGSGFHSTGSTKRRAGTDYWDKQALLAACAVFRAAFDLYRGDLAKALGLATPPSVERERILWKNVGSFMYRNVVPNPELLNGARFALTNDRSSAAEDA